MFVHALHARVYSSVFVCSRVLALTCVFWRVPGGAYTCCNSLLGCSVRRCVHTTPCALGGTVHVRTLACSHASRVFLHARAHAPGMPTLPRLLLLPSAHLSSAVTRARTHLSTLRPSPCARPQEPARTPTNALASLFAHARVLAPTRPRVPACLLRVHGCACAHARSLWSLRRGTRTCAHAYLHVCSSEPRPTLRSPGRPWAQQDTPCGPPLPGAQLPGHPSPAPCARPCLSGLHAGSCPPVTTGSGSPCSAHPAWGASGWLLSGSPVRPQWPQSSCLWAFTRAVPFASGIWRRGPSSAPPPVTVAPI